MDQDSSLSTSFDFNSQAGVMSLLAAIRASTLTPAQKNELRDLVFLYANGGGDVSVRIALEQKLTASNIKPTAKVEKPPVQPVQPVPVPEVVLPFGQSRPEPMFKTPVVPVFVPPVVVPVATPIPVQSPEPVIADAVTQTPVTPITPEPVITNPVLEKTVTPVIVTSEPVAPIPVTPEVVTAKPVVPVAANSNVYLDRIREIKSAVNSKVGNPVNLVDINNDVGREYMNALLDAMKRLSGGPAGQIDVAMRRLETAYQAVEVAIADHNKTTAVPVAIAEETLTVSVQSPVSTPDTVPTVASVTSEPEFIPVAPDLLEEKDVAVEQPVPVPIRKPEKFVPDKGPSGFEAGAVAPAKPVQVVASSILNDEKVLTPEDLPIASALTTSETGDPLFTREIDDGLEQLLSDWLLFKKSGLFGTGPKGREHPLFKKIAELQIPLLLAGRFEGSTQEIKQSITDYMNGWRYEQGIIYEQGETFERYLRRVIKQILDLQKKRRAA